MHEKEAKRIVNEEDLVSNPQLVEAGVKVGDLIPLSHLGTRDGDPEDTIPKPASEQYFAYMGLNHLHKDCPLYRGCLENNIDAVNQHGKLVLEASRKGIAAYCPHCYGVPK